MVILAGFIGAQNPQENVAVVTVWVIAWVGLAFICALVGNIWALANPWDALFKWAALAVRRATGGAALARGRPYPAWLGTWPAFAVFFVFAWM